MSKEMIKSAFFEKELASETVSVSAAVLEALGCDPTSIEDKHLREEVQRWTDLLEDYRKSGWKRYLDLPIQEKATVEYLPWAMLWRLADQAGKSLNEERKGGRSLRMYQYVADKLGLDQDPRGGVIGRLDQKIDQIFQVYEGDSRIDTIKLSEIVNPVIEAQFPSAW